MPYCDLILNRRYPAPLENGFLPGAPNYSDRARLAFRRAISCSDIRLAADELSYELYAPNHFARQFGLIQLVPFPLYDAWNFNTSWRRIGPSDGPPPEQSMLVLVDLPDWANDIVPVDGAAEDYDQWWKEVSVNCWRQRDDELFAAIFEELRYPYDADTEALAHFHEDEERSPPPEPARRPARAPRLVQSGIIIREHPPEGRAPPSGNRAVGVSPATGPAAKQKAVLTKPDIEDTSSDDDNPQTIAAALARKRSRAELRTNSWAEDEPVADRLVRRRISRQVGEGSSAAGEGASGTKTQENNGGPPSAINAADNMQLVVIPEQVIVDSSPEVEERMSLLPSFREEPIPLLASTVPDLDPILGETAPVPTANSRELPVEEGPNAEAVVEEIADEDPAEPVLNVAGLEPAPHAPQVIEAGGPEEFPEPVPEAILVAEPLETPVAEQPTPSTLERLARVLEVTPPGVVDDAREGLRRFLGPDILIPGAPARVLEYLRVLISEGAVAEDQFQEIDQLLQDLPQGLNERAVANAQAKQTEAQYQALTHQTDNVRGFLGDQADLIRDLTLERNHLRSQIQALQARLTDVTTRARPRGASIRTTPRCLRDAVPRTGPGSGSSPTSRSSRCGC